MKDTSRDLDSSVLALAAGGLCAGLFVLALDRLIPWMMGR